MTREEAVKILDCYDIGFCDLSGEKIPADKLADAFDMAIEALYAERTGKWIYCEDEAEEYVDGYRCDQCGYFVPWDFKHKSPYFIEEYHYCPSCKARMKGDTTE